MTNLSPAAQAILTAVTQRQYSCDPIDVPEATGRIKYEAAAALRAVADYAQRSSYAAAPSTDWGDGWKVGVSDTAQGLIAIADELEALPK
jgi:hypothetical protein